MNRLFTILLFLITASSCNVVKSQQSSFDKEKWLISSEYRYEISKSENFPDLKGKSKDDVKHILGDPCEVNGEKFIYCFNIEVKSHYDEQLQQEVCNCKGSYVVIDFKIDDRWRTTFVKVEREVIRE